MTHRFFFPLSFLALFFSCLAAAQQPDWNFAVAGDSRNCGDVVMPSIAAGAKAGNAQFYWHLGDFRHIADFDQDILAVPDANGKPIRWNIRDYELYAWNDFINRQLRPFGDIPVYLATGNHEFYVNRSRNDYIVQFADWVNSAAIQKQRLADNPSDHLVRTWYHWVQGGVDFITLDNATLDQFEGAQVRWFEGVLKRDETDPQVRAVVVGMHAALPDSLASGHSMNDWTLGEQSGRQVYTDLLKFRERTKKPVYALASHSHFYMEGIFDTDEWRAHRGVIPGWIVGTAGAERYKLPDTATKAKDARTDAYGFLLATVHADGSIDFRFNQVTESDVPMSVVQRYGATFVHECYANNSQNHPPVP